MRATQGNDLGGAAAPPYQSDYEERLAALGIDREAISVRARAMDATVVPVIGREERRPGVHKAEEWKVNKARLPRLAGTRRRRA